MSEESFQEKTESATPRRRDEARDRGQVARSTELNSFAIVFFGLMFLFFGGPALFAALSGLMQQTLAVAGGAPGNSADAVVFLRRIGWQFLAALGPLFVFVIAIGILVNAAQVGFRLSPKALEPKFDKFNMVKGFKRLLSSRSVVQLIRDVIKLSLITTVAYFAVRAEMDGFLGLSDMGAGGILTFAGGALFRVGLKIVLSLLALALFDFAYQRWDFEKSIRMTKHDVKEEMKQYEGSPLMRSRVRQVQRELARMRMSQEIPSADVVVTNPTHVAVAIRYDNDAMGAPTVVAKGARLLAQKIREIAKAAGVPIVENPPLARALYSSVEIGGQIPAELYRACAEVLAYVYRLKNKTQALASAGAVEA